MNKVVNLQEAARMVVSGSSVAIGGLSTQTNPMAFIRALIREKVQNLTVVTVANGIGVDILVGAGCVTKILGVFIGYEYQSGRVLPANVRKAAQQGQLEISDYSEVSLVEALRASDYGLPFLPTRACIGSDILKMQEQNGNMKMIQCPFTGEKLVAVKACRPDYAVIHVHKADELGNAQLEFKPVTHDVLFAGAAKKVIVVTEKIVSSDEIRRNAEKTVLPHFLVDAVVEVPFGAHPTSCYPFYRYDEEFYDEYILASESPDRFKDFLQKYVYMPKTQGEYLNLVGGAETLIKIKI